MQLALNWIMYCDHPLEHVAGVFGYKTSSEFRKDFYAVCHRVLMWMRV